MRGRKWHVAYEGDGTMVHTPIRWMTVVGRQAMVADLQARGAATLCDLPSWTLISPQRYWVPDPHRIL